MWLRQLRHMRAIDVQLYPQHAWQLALPSVLCGTVAGWRLLQSQTQYLVLGVLVLTHFENASALTLVYPLSALCYACFETPRPHPHYWRFLFFYPDQFWGHQEADVLRAVVFPCCPAGIDRCIGIYRSRKN